VTDENILTDIPGFNEISAIESSGGLPNCSVENCDNYSNINTLNLTSKSPLAQSSFIEILSESSIINSTQTSIETHIEQTSRYLYYTQLKTLCKHNLSLFSLLF
jgi:hypothetical protein